jgi:U3 small nucleolar ribonucleoprotein component
MAGSHSTAFDKDKEVFLIEKGIASRINKLQARVTQTLCHIGIHIVCDKQGWRRHSEKLSRKRTHTCLLRPTLEFHTVLNPTSVQLKISLRCAEL